MKFGLRIPSYAWPDLTYDSSSSLLDYCRRVDDGPYEDIWVIDHLLASRGTYSLSWLDPIITLSAAAGVTTRVGLGTAVLVIPIRQPVLLAKEVASLHLLSGGRFRLGVGIGWDPAEFGAIDIPLSERGKRTDEALELLRLLLTESGVTFRGRFWEVEGLTINPRVPTMPPVWVAGGTLAYAAKKPEEPHIAETALRRILAADGWIAQSADRGVVKNHLELVRAYLTKNGRDPDGLTFSATQFLHVVEAPSGAEAWEQQLPRFRGVMDEDRTIDDLRTSYLTGTIDEIQSAVSDLGDSGLDHLILTPLVNDPGQLDLITRHVVEPFAANPRSRKTASSRQTSQTNTPK